MDNAQEFYTAQELAELLRIHEATVRRLEKAGKLKGVRLGRSVRYRRRDVEAALATDTPKA